MRLFLFLFLLIGSFSLKAAADYDRSQIEQRIKPVGKVRLQEESPPPAEKPMEEPAAPIAKEASGQKTYEQFCSVCHKGGLAGAPKFRNEAEWKPRLETRKIEGLTANAVKGMNAMPAKGTCTSCSDADIKEAILYMLPQS